MRKRFGEIATFSRGLTFSKGDVVSESSKRVLRSNNIDLATHSLVFDDIACLKEGFIIPDDKMLHRNDIFICMSNGSTQQKSDLHLVVLWEPFILMNHKSFLNMRFMPAYRRNIDASFPPFSMVLISII